MREQHQKRSKTLKFNNLLIQKHMKVSINLLGIALFVAILFSCNSAGNEGDSSNVDAADNAESENKVTE